MRWSIAIAAVVGAMGTPATAEKVSAADPQGLMAAMSEAGFPTTLEKDGYGDPVVRTRFGDFEGSVYFYGCDLATHEGCDSVQFRAGLDRASAMPPDLLNAIVRKYRYTAVWLDDEGDPWVNFDVYTGEGIPKAVFLQTLAAFASNFGSVADMTFAEERRGADRTSAP